MLQFIMPEVLKEIVDKSILIDLVGRSRNSLGSPTSEQTLDLYNDIFDKVLETAKDSPWFITGELSPEQGNNNPTRLTWLNGDYSQVPDDSIEAVTKLTNSITCMEISKIVRGNKIICKLRQNDGK